MNILIAPDKFKGSLTARQVCGAVEEALRAVRPSLTITCFPMADGGEGTCELLTAYSGGMIVNVMVCDPLFRKIASGYGLSPDGTTAFIEMATASGLQLLQKDERDPRATTTRGTGELIAHALDRGVTKIFMGVGGSATNDGGMGMAAALGVVFYDAAGETLLPVGENLSRIHGLDATALHPRLKHISLTMFYDVDNPLHGPRGAAAVFSPQKGADAATVALLDAGLRHYEKILMSHFHTPVNFPGAGAGGGLPASLCALTRVQVRRGIDFTIAFTQLEERVRQADLIITGEGKIDTQTLAGKVVQGVGALGLKYNKPVWAVCGKCEIDAPRLASIGVTQVIALTGDQATEAEAMQHAQRLLRQRVQQHAASYFV